MKRALVVLAVTFGILTAGVFLAPVPNAHAAFPGHCKTTFFGLPAWYKYLDGDTNCDLVGPAKAGGNADNDLDWQKAIGYIAIAVVEGLLRVSGLIAVGYVIYGGFRFMTSQGSPDGAASARTTIINALIGLVIAVSAASIVSFIGTRLGSQTSDSPNAPSQQQPVTPVNGAF